MKPENIILKSKRECFFIRYGDVVAREFKKKLKEKNNFNYSPKVANSGIYNWDNDIKFYINIKNIYFSYSFLTNITSCNIQNTIETQTIKNFIEELNIRLEELILTKNTCQNCIHRFNYELMDVCENTYTRRIYK